LQQPPGITKERPTHERTARSGAGSRMSVQREAERDRA
jgi:hypothetical protein